MMKVFCCLIILSLLFSCNDSTQPVKPAETKEDELKRMAASYPDSALLVENLVQYYRENGNYVQALKVTNDQVKKDSTQIEWWDIKATLDYENGDTTSAIRAFEKAADIQPLPGILISLGSIYAQTRNPKALMIADALMLADKASADKEALFIKGLYYNYVGDKKKAIGFFDACLDLDYTYMFAYREKAIALYDLARYDEALKVLDRAVTLENSYEEGYYWIGRCYEKLARPEEAATAYRKALMYDKDYIEAKDALSRLGL